MCDHAFLSNCQRQQCLLIFVSMEFMICVVRNGLAKCLAQNNATCARLEKFYVNTIAVHVKVGQEKGESKC